MSETRRSPLVARLDACTSPLLLVLAALVVLSIPFPELTVAAGAVTVLVLVAALATSTARTRSVAFLLLGIGVGCLAITWIVFRDPPQASMLSRMNQDIIGLFASAAFVRTVVTVRPNARPPRLAGRPAVFRTAFATHFMSSVLNIVTLGIVGDRLSSGRRIGINDASLMTQAFAAAALWSPFWAVSAVIVSYTPDAPILALAAVGIGFAVVVTAVAATWSISRRSPVELQDHGYALQPSLLAVPAFLIAVVLLGHQLLPETPIPRLVLLASLCIPVLASLRASSRGSRPLAEFARLSRVSYAELRGSANESALFIAAGVLTIGVSSLILHLPWSFDGLPATVALAWCFALAITVLSALGIHPIITVSTVYAVGLITPESAVLYAAAVMWGWCTAMPLGPLSGTLIFVSGRFGVPIRAMIRANVPFTVFALALAWPGIALAGLLAG